MLALGILAVLAPGARAQNAAQAGPVWKRIGAPSVHAGLADPASGPVSAVWYAANGNRLLSQTAAGRVFELAADGQWRLNTTDSAPSTNLKTAGDQRRLYSMSPSNVYASEDGGRAWINLTGFNDRSVIGSGFTSIAVSPSNPLEIAAANQSGVWRSHDGGLSWRGLNDELPNLSVRRLLGRRTAVLADGASIAFENGAWKLVAGSPDPETVLRARLAGRNFKAAAQAGSLIYAATAEGRLLASRDNGASWLEAAISAGAVDRIWADPDRPESALAAAGARLLRTVNGGLFWDDVTGALPAARIHGIAADRLSNAVYVATDRGVFLGALSLHDAGGPATGWTAVSRDLPAAPAWDVRLNPDNTLTVALDGYGVFETPAPHKARAVRLVNAADMSDRAAAPGSLISVMGANVRQGGVSGVPYPVIASADESSQLQVPFEAGAGVFQLALEGPTDRWLVPVTVKNASPAIFVDSDGAPLLLDAASGLVLDPHVPVRASAGIQILATGLGKVTPDWPSGIPAPFDAPPSVTGVVTAFLDGAPVEVTRATLAPGYVGYYVVELKIPATVNRGTSEFRIVMNGEESNRVRMYLEPDLDR